MADPPVTRRQSSRLLVTPPADVWALLSNPVRHAEADASGMVQGAVTTEPLTAVGQVFTMEVVHGGGTDREIRYRTDNLVDVLEPGRVIGWRTGEVGKPPAGWFWRYFLRPDNLGTEVTLVYDWSDASPEVVELVGLPAFTQADLASSLAALSRALGGSTF